MLLFAELQNHSSNGEIEVVQFLNEKNEDITNKIIKFAGLRGDFHGIQTTPRMVGEEKCKIILENGDEKKYKSDDIFDFF